MARLALILTAVAATATSARAEIAVEAGVPFTAAELTSLLALRGATTNGIVVRAVSPTAVELRTSIGSQRIDLGAARGAAAARLVALQLATLGTEPTPSADPASPVAMPAAKPSWTFAATGGGGHGATALDFALTALRFDATRGRGRWRWGVGVGWLHGLATTPDGTNPASADLFPIRAVAGLAAGRLQVVAGPELVAYRVSAASPGITAGAGAGLRVRLIGGARWHAIASADLDGFRHRVVVERAGVPFTATPRVALAAALGLAWGSP